MLPAGFEPAIPASEWPQTDAVDRAATGIGNLFTSNVKCTYQNACDMPLLRRTFSNVAGFGLILGCMKNINMRVQYVCLTSF